MSTDYLAPSQSPPCGLSASEVPMFVSLGFDDNGDAEGMRWVLEMTKARGVNVTFFNTSAYGAQPAVLDTWKQARRDGHEIGNHTVTHLPNHGGKGMSAEQWRPEIAGCTEFLLTSGVVEDKDLFGFRAPYLEYSDGMLSDVTTLGFRYDSSIEEGYEAGQDGTNFFWPYTLDELSPGHTVQVSWGDGLAELTPHEGLWELPVYTVFVPPELRTKIAAVQDWFDPAGGQITGFDYNLWSSKDWGGFEMSKEDFIATLKHSFDQRLEGNRAPFLFGAHSAYYADAYDTDSSTRGSMPNATAAERREALEVFLDYVLAQPNVRVVPYAEVLRWMRDPKPL